MNKKIVVCKLIDYVFQNKEQLTEAYDDSNSMRYLSWKFSLYVIGRLQTPHPMLTPVVIDVENYKVIFLPKAWNPMEVWSYIERMINPDVIHMHGNHSWPSYPFYASNFKHYSPDIKKMIFSPAGSSCGTSSFLDHFDHIVVNHPLQIDRMKTPHKDRVIVRKRCADPIMFYPGYAEKVEYDCVYVAGFVPVKQIEVMIETVSNSDNTLVIVGDFTRTAEHYNHIRKVIDNEYDNEQIFLKNFMLQDDLCKFLGKCGVFVWPNIKPENPSTTTNRSVVEALACGMPLLLGERAFAETYFVSQMINGALYSHPLDFCLCLEHILIELEHFRFNARGVYNTRFSFQRDFIDFYNELYSI
jgi:glycosyltransferase involved in cell wall biosynthesis